MIWTICLFASIAIFILSICNSWIAGKRYKKGGLVTPINTFFVGVFLAVCIGMVPILVGQTEAGPAYILRIILLSGVQTLQVFTVNIGAELILDNISSTETSLSTLYSAYMAFLFCVAPILTFGVLISLLKNVLADVVYRLRFWKDVYVFSELNEKSLLLAASIRRNHKSKVMLVFTNVDRGEKDLITEQLEAAKELNAVIFQRDIISVDFSKHSKKSAINLFTIGDKESENLILGLKLIDKYRDRANTGLYVFSSGAEGEMLLSNAKQGAIKVRRVDEIRSLVYKFLDEDGVSLFESAKEVEDSDEKVIHAVVVGLGKYGTEMLKAILWYGQMDGYTLKVDAFEKDPLAEAKFAALCPEIMLKQDPKNGVRGEDRYEIRIHSGVVAGTKQFEDQIASYSDISFAFIGLGNDDENINQAARIRMICERAGLKPMIKTVVYSVDEHNLLKDIRNFKNEKYNIDAIGDYQTMYSEEILVCSEMEEIALMRHKAWGEEDTFWQYEYNYRSSLASVVHIKARILCDIPGVTKKQGELTEQEREFIERLEHRRWNAYMRSEGYVFSGSGDKSSRNDLAKKHHCLVEFDALPDSEKRKDGTLGETEFIAMCLKCKEERMLASKAE